MRKINGTRICSVLSILLLLGFIIKTVTDYIQYSKILNSAPFYVWILANMIYFIIPAIIIFIVGIVIRNK